MNNKQWFILVLMLLSCRALIAQANTERKVDSLLALSREYVFSGSLKKARSTQKTAEKLVLENFGKESRPWASALVNRARISNSEKDTLTTINYLKESIGLFGKLGVNHRDLGRAYNNLGCQYLDNLDDPKAAESYFRKSLDVINIIKDDTLYLLSSMRNLGIVLNELENYAEAVTVFEKCVELYEEDLENNLNSYLESIDFLAENLLALGKQTEAEYICLKAKTTREKTNLTESTEYASNWV